MKGRSRYDLRSEDDGNIHQADSDYSGLMAPQGWALQR